ncbi:MAG: GTPase HflX, partial [Bacteroidales bacterium]|nr:GTPase HflX [Bacteroidales bacterium]
MIDYTKKNIEKAVLVSVITQQQDETKAIEYLDELEFLTLTAGGKAVKRFTQKLEYPNPKTYIGVGKLDEVKEYIEAHNIATVIFD